jgi:hypothetical protein
MRLERRDEGNMTKSRGQEKLREEQALREREEL